MKNLFLSNSSDQLTKALEENLFAESAFPLRKKFIVLPHKKDKEPLVEWFLQRRQSCIGLQFFTLSELLSYPREGLESLRLQQAIHQHLDLPAFAPIKHYFNNDLSKIPPFAKALAKTLKSYELYGIEKMSPWQQLLYRPSLRSPEKIPADLHIFRVAHIPDGAKRILEKMEGVWDIYYYLLSPSHYYWGDLSTDRQRLTLQKMFQKQGISQEERDTFDLYARDRHPLLANLVHYGADLLTYLIDQNVPSREAYEEKPGITNALLHWQEEAPQGVTLHATPSKKREIEVLYNNILSLFWQDRDLSPHDIRIFAPQISSYFPLIQMVFGSKESKLPHYVVADLPHSILYKDLHALLHLKNPSDFFQKVEEPLWKQWAKEGVREVLLYTLLPSEAPILEEFLRIWTSLEQDLAYFQQNHTLQEWVTFLRQFTGRYLSCDLTSFSSHIGALTTLPPTNCPYSFIKPYIEEFFEARTYTFRSSTSASLLFSNLGEGAILPAKHIFLLGMDEESFPSAVYENPLTSSPREPSSADRDRFALLTALLGADLTISYQNIHPQDGKEQGPSLLLQGIYDHIVEHPTVPFHASYFSPNSPQRSFSEKEYRLALLHHSKPKHEKKPLPTPPTTWHLKDFARLHHPSRFHAQHVLNIYLKEPEPEGEFALSFLERYQWKTQLAKKPTSEILKEFRHKSGIQNPLFQQAALLELEKECAKIEPFIEETWSRTQTPLLTFHENCHTPFEHTETHTVLPPLLVGDRWRIVGTMPLTFLSFSKSKEKELCRFLPNMLIMNILNKNPQIVFAELQIVEEVSIEHPMERLISYLHYADHVFQRPCPFLPEWLDFLEDTNKWQGAIASSEDPYIQYFQPFTELEKWHTLIKNGLLL